MEGDLAADRARLQVLRRDLGARLATCRTAAGISQPQLAQAVGRTRSMISKVEHGTRTLSVALWKIADDLCGAGGVLVAQHEGLARAERDYRDRYRTHQRQTQGQRAQAQAVPMWPALISPAVLLYSGDEAWPQTTLVHLGGGCATLAKELMAVVTKLVRSLGRRDAIHLAGSVLAAAGLGGLDADEYTRLAHAIQAPSRVDAQVVQNLAAILAYNKRLEDKLGPCQVLDTVIAQHRLVHRLLAGDCADHLRKPLSLVDSNMASAIGGYLVDMGHPQEAKGYFEHARAAAHDAGNSTFGAYAAINTSFAAFLRGDTPTALDTAAAARSLAARTQDVRLKALAEEQAAGAFALDGQYGPCMAACVRAHQFLAGANGCAPDSPAYWVDEGTLDSKRSTFLSLLGKPEQAVEAASNACSRFDRAYVGLYTRCQVRLGHALVLSHDITEAARVLADAANHANLSPRLMAELRAARALMQPWENTKAVTELDVHLHAYGLTSAACIPPRPGTYPGQHV